MNPYTAPREAGVTNAAAATADDLAAYDADPTVLDPKLPRSAAAAGFFAAVMAMLAGWQTLDSVRLRDFYVVFPYLMLLLGGASFACGLALFRARSWAAIATAVATGLLALVSATWLLLAMAHGFFALYSLFTPPAALLSAVLSVASINAVARATRLRKHFEAEGMRLR